MSPSCWFRYCSSRYALQRLVRNLRPLRTRFSNLAIAANRTGLHLRASWSMLVAIEFIGIALAGAARLSSL